MEPSVSEIVQAHGAHYYHGGWCNGVGISPPLCSTIEKPFMMYLYTAAALLVAPGRDTNTAGGGFASDHHPSNNILGECSRKSGHSTNSTPPSARLTWLEYFLSTRSASPIERAMASRRSVNGC